MTQPLLLEWLARNEVGFEANDAQIDLSLPGQSRLQIPVRISIGTHAITIAAFVCRNPDENHQAVYRWLLERNLKMFGYAFCVDRLGDIYLHAKLANAQLAEAEIDRLMGSVLAYADEAFNPLLELGFASAIKKEWRWRIERGESTANLEAFRGWLVDPSD